MHSLLGAQCPVDIYGIERLTPFFRIPGKASAGLLLSVRENGEVVIALQRSVTLANVDLYD